MVLLEPFAPDDFEAKLFKHGSVTVSRPYEHLQLLFFKQSVLLRLAVRENELHHYQVPIMLQTIVGWGNKVLDVVGVQGAEAPHANNAIVIPWNICIFSHSNNHNIYHYAKLNSIIEMIVIGFTDLPWNDIYWLNLIKNWVSLWKNRRYSTGYYINYLLCLTLAFLPLFTPQPTFFHPVPLIRSRWFPWWWSFLPGVSISAAQVLYCVKH